MDEHYEMPPGEVIIAPGVLVTIVAMTAQAQPGVLRLSPRTPSPGLGRIRPRGATAEGLRIDLLDDGNAAGTWGLYYHLIDTRQQTVTQLGACYRDEYRKLDGRWLISASVCEVNSTYTCELQENTAKVVFAGKAPR